MVATSLGLVPVPVRFPWGSPIDLKVVAEQVRQNPDASAVAVVHHETSTGMLNPLEAVSRLAHDSGLPIIVDAVSSAGGVPLSLDRWGIDLCVTVPNKCLEAPPGVVIVAVSPHAWERIDRAAVTGRGWYLDLRVWRSAFQRHPDHPLPVTMPSNVIAGLNVALKRLFNEGFAGHCARISATSRTVREGLGALGFRPVVEGPSACPIVTAFVCRPDVNVSDLSDYLKAEHGLMISGAMGQMADTCFRIGHMGKGTSPEYLGALFAGVKAFLKARGLPDKPPTPAND
jgi:aspartate aminotransferase-like enzyme